jgi:hypothetical protein
MRSACWPRSGFGCPLRGKAILWYVGFGSWVFPVGLLDRQNFWSLS